MNLLKLLKKISIIAEGMLLASAMVIPGVSIATMSCILGIYERLILIVKDIFSAKIPEKKNLCFVFFLGMGGIFCLIFISKHILEIVQYHSQSLFSFLFGTSISSVLVSSNTTKGKFHILLTTSICIILFYPIKGTIIEQINRVSDVSIENYSSIRLIFWTALAMSFSLLPGLSGSLVLIVSGFLGMLHKSVLNILSGRITLLDTQLWINFFLGIVLGGFMMSKLLVYCYKRKISWIYVLTNGLSISAMFFLFVSAVNSIEEWEKICTFFCMGLISLQLVQCGFKSKLFVRIR